jgi:Zn finger protein HypA/HybF involved in hydrogenase expression
MTKKEFTQECLRCGHVWKSHKEKPIACPKCKSYNFNKKSKWEGK